MSDLHSLPPPDRDRVRRKPQAHFNSFEERAALVKKMIAAENAVIDAKTAKLRALRLAKEEADREEAEAAPAPTAKRAASKAAPKKRRNLPRVDRGKDPTIQSSSRSLSLSRS